MRNVKDFGEDTVYFVSYSRLPNNVSARYIHEVVGVGFLINCKTGVIEDMMVTLLSDLCKEFLAFLTIGHNMNDGVDEIVEKVEKRFFGQSQKAVVTSIKGVNERYIAWKEEEGIE